MAGSHRWNVGSRAQATRALGLFALLALLGTACGQIGAAHQRSVGIAGGQPVNAVGFTNQGAEGTILIGQGASDVGGAKNTFSGDSTQLASQAGSTLVQRITRTTYHAPQ